MTANDRVSDDDAPSRDIYEVYHDGDRNVARIADPENGGAWIQSDTVQPIVR